MSETMKREWDEYVPAKLTVKLAAKGYGEGDSIILCLDHGGMPIAHVTSFLCAFDALHRHMEELEQWKEKVIRQAEDANEYVLAQINRESKQRIQKLEQEAEDSESWKFRLESLIKHIDEGLVVDDYYLAAKTVEKTYNRIQELKAEVKRKDAQNFTLRQRIARKDGYTLTRTDTGKP